jgi:two-component system NtrC family sensor kinase
MSATADRTLVDPQKSIADLQRQLAECRAERDEALTERDKAQRRLGELTAERDEALEQQTATAEVLQVINSSPGQLAPVFDAMLEKAIRLCEAAFGILWTYDGETFSPTAVHGPTAFVEFYRDKQRLRAVPGSWLARHVSGEDLGEIADMANDPYYREGHPRRRAYVELGGARSATSVALRKEGMLLGAIQLYRQEVRPFFDKQIALLQNFAAQAVIAMENARLLTETREALEQQTATAEVLGVINSSPGDLTPVFDAMLDKATRLCEAAFGILLTHDGDRFHFAALRSIPPAYAEFMREHPPIYGPGTSPGELALGARFVHVVDLTDTDSYRSGDPNRRAIADLAGARTLVAVPLRKHGALLGAIVVFRKEVHPFTDKQIALLQNFAAQAVIAMENARLLTETREALEQQTATAEVLQVINSSPGDLTPVFDAILEKAHALCGVAHGALMLCDGDHFHAAAVRNYSEAFADRLRQGFRGSENPVTRPLIDGVRFAQFPDLAELDHPVPKAAAELAGVRTALFVPLRKDDGLLGMISGGRLEIRPFSQKEIALLENFAAQAVIAMENARLITELREALAQQTATAEVLQVINSSPGDLAPVFDSMLEKATRLCEAPYGQLATYDGEFFRFVAVHGYTPFVEQQAREPVPPSFGVTWPRLVSGEPVVHMPDVRDTDIYRSGHERALRFVEIGSGRSLLTVALRKDDILLGALSIYRQEVRPFTDKQIALLQSFAAQAVIAMENARLLNELRERTRDLEESLEYQTAISDVLQVISRSTFDLQPVLDKLVETASRLCAADNGLILSREEDGVRVTATFSSTPEFEAFIRGRLLPLSRGSVAGRAFAERKPVQIPDLIADPEYTVAETVTLGKTRTGLGVPLMRAGEVIGAISLGRQRVEPFTERQIELVRTFADQAVIAIENTRLITETREALEQQTATAQVLQVINSSPGDLAPVYDVILEKARSLCDVPIGGLMLYDGERFRTVALHGFPERFLEEALRPFPPGPPHERLIRGERLLYEADYQAVSLPGRHPAARALVELGVRTTLVVPLRKDGNLLGFLAANRLEVRPFSDKEIALLESFAAQAVIAMDNARLLNEIRQRQAELRVTFDNMGDGVAMFDGELRLAAWNLNFQRILELPDPMLAERPRVGDFIRYLATHGEYGAVDVEAEVRRLSERVATQWSAERTRPDGRVIEVRSNPVPGGGVVLIYSDITERKRAEAEIRAARDTAERALRELQTTQASLVHAQKMAALGQLTAGIAHEIKNPLNFVNNFAELSGELLLELKETTAPAVAALGDDERAAVDEVVEMLRGNLDKIAEHGKRADGIVKSMLEHSRGVSGERRVVDLNALIEEALNLAYHGARAQDASFNITLECEFDRGLTPTELAPQEMTRVFLNLFGNGFYATAKRQRDGAGPEFRPTLKVTTRDLGEVVEVRLRDNGTGIAPEIRDKLFQPFVTTKPTGEGTGLGLSIAYDIVTQQHGGTISVDSQVGEFTEFTIRLPCACVATIAEAAA